jgi:polyhydroxybutyrate depolymerase
MNRAARNLVKSGLLLGMVSIGIYACGQSNGGGSGGAAGSTGGPTGTGGATSTGGTSATGGQSSSAGASGTGGRLGTGGASGGVAGTGSANSTGGTRTGGMTAAGGSPAAGGATGGAVATGGVPSTGGSKATGGATAAGGAGAGGTSNSAGCGNTTLPAACNTTTTGPCSIDVGGLTRQYFAVLPSNYDPNTPAPVVFTWHYMNGSAQGLLNGMGYQGAMYGIAKAFPKAIYLVPQGLPSTSGGTDYGWPNTNGQDINFAKAMLDWAESNYCVDKNRLFSAGHSYGAMFSDTIGCQMPDVFRAIAASAGGLFGSRCVSHGIAAWITHGTADTSVAISSGESARDYFVKNNGCDTTNTQSEVLDANTTCTIYNVCTIGNYPVEWCPVTGAGHVIPTWAGAQIAKFFMQF